MLQTESHVHQSENLCSEISPAFVDKAGLAQLLGRTPRYVEHLVERHLIPFIRIPARRPGIIRGSINGKTFERAKRGGQLFFCPGKVFQALERFEVQPEPSNEYRPRGQRRSMEAAK
jgi:hypothetical protein